MVFSIKPSNFLMDERGHVRLVDFGTAKHNASLSSEDSVVGIVLKPLTSSEYCGSQCVIRILTRAPCPVRA